MQRIVCHLSNNKGHNLRETDIFPFISVCGTLFFPDVLPGGADILWGVRIDWKRHSDQWQTWENGIASHLPFLACLLHSAAYFSHCGWIGHLLLVTGSPRAAVHMRLWVKDAKILKCCLYVTEVEWNRLFSDGGT